MRGHYIRALCPNFRKKSRLNQPNANAHTEIKKLKKKKQKKTFAFPSCAVSHVRPGLPVIPLT